VRALLSISLLLAFTGVVGQTDLVKIDGSGKLSYNKDANGFIIPDFSRAGYRGGGIEIPEVTVVKQISPVEGDNTAHIQAAINEVGSREKDANGIRGTLLLNAGRYEVNGTLQVNYDGVVLRGVGNTDSASNSTIIYAKGNTPHQRDVIVLGNTVQNKWNSKISGTQKNITDDVVPVGATSFSVTSASPYQVGDAIAIYHPCSDLWLEAIDYGGVPAPASGEADERWTVNKAPVVYHRYITNIEGNKITIDAPVFYTLNKSLSQSYVYKFNSESILKEIGIENLRVEIESLGGTDENHAWQAIRFKTVGNCWARNVITVGFGQSGFITECCTRSTIEDCEAIDPVSVITGERRYNFNTYTHSQLILFKNCYAREGRHNFISNGTSYASGNVFLNCTSDAANSVSEGHRQWSQGFLFDNHKDVNLKRDFVLGLYNRVDMGTGHGWAAVHSVLWNCDVTSRGVIGLQKPPTAQNYAIGCTAKSITGKPVSSSDFERGYVELQNNPVTGIQSLYVAQLNDRLNASGNSISTTQRTEKPYVLDSLSKGQYMLSFDDGVRSGKKINVFSVSGQLVLSETIRGKSGEVKLPMSSGMYVLQILIDSNTYTEKLIVII